MSELRWVAPHVSESPEGETTFEWWCGERKITCWTKTGERGSGLRVWGIRIFDDMAEFDAADPDEFKRAWVWLLGGET